MQGKQGTSGASSCSASKWGILGLMKSASMELGKHKVTVNALIPGLVDTALTRYPARYHAFQAMTANEPQKDPTPQEVWDARLPMVPLRVDWIKPADLGPAAVFLASDGAAWSAAPSTRSMQATAHIMSMIGRKDDSAKINRAQPEERRWRPYPLNSADDQGAPDRPASSLAQPLHRSPHVASPGVGSSRRRVMDAGLRSAWPWRQPGPGRGRTVRQATLGQRRLRSRVSNGWLFTRKHSE